MDQSRGLPLSVVKREDEREEAAQMDPGCVRSVSGGWGHLGCRGCTGLEHVTQRGRLHFSNPDLEEQNEQLKERLKNVKAVTDNVSAASRAASKLCCLQAATGVARKRRLEATADCEQCLV